MDRLWLWRRPTTVREILEDLAPDRKLAYTTIMTVMDNLHRKGLLTREQDGRAYRYSTVRSRSEHTADLIASVLAKSDDRTAPLLRFVERLNPDEVARLRASLDALEAAAPPDKGTRAGRG
jgi:predicted transcriptional regulator